VFELPYSSVKHQYYDGILMSNPVVFEYYLGGWEGVENFRNKLYKANDQAILNIESYCLTRSLVMFKATLNLKQAS